MTEDSSKKWKVFEKLVAEIQRCLAPGAKILLNETIIGKISKTPRQIDILIRQNVGQFHLVIAIECKDHKHPVDVGLVEEFISKLRDIEANKGAMVSASGFTVSAKRVALEAGIDLYRIVDTESQDWRAYVAIPVLCDLRSLVRAQFEYKSNSPGPCIVPTPNPQLLFIYRENGSVVDTAWNMLSDKWNKGELPEEPGVHKDIKLANFPTCVMFESTLYHLDVSVNIEVAKALYLGQVQVGEMKGLFDEHKRSIIAKNTFALLGIDLKDIETKWTPVKSEGDLAVKPRFTIRARSGPIRK